MCLVIDDELTRQFKKRTKPFTAFKVYDLKVCIISDAPLPVDKQMLEYRFLKGNPEFSPSGIVKSDRKAKALTIEEQTTGQINHGIHVFLDHDAAENVAYSNSVILKVTVDPKHLVAASNDKEAVFTQIKIPQEILKLYPKNVKRTSTSKSKPKSKSKKTK